MKRFRFSLETVLRVRRQVEEQRQRELAEAQARRDKTLAWLGSTENSVRDLARDQNLARGGRIDLGAEAWYLARHKGLLDSIRHLKADLARNEADLGAAREKAVEAARERRVLEKLEEAQRNVWQRSLNLEEQGFMDELAQRARSAFSLPTVSADGL